MGLPTAQISPEQVPLPRARELQIVQAGKGGRRTGRGRQGGRGRERERQRGREREGEGEGGERERERERA
eukprot:96670-Rhodomonas_salina.1